MLHIFSSRGPSQKLSKPVPNNGLRTRVRSTPQTSVRSVSVGFRPIVARTPGLTPRNTIEEEITSMTTVRACTTAGLRIATREFAAKNRVLAIRKEPKDEHPILGRE